MAVINVYKSGWQNVLRDTLKEFRDTTVDKEVRKTCELYCQNLLFHAVKARMQANGAHNITGNLLNSIVVVLFKNSQPEMALTAGDANVRPTRYHKMTKTEQGWYFYKIDYSGQKAFYKPSVVTDKGKGIDDAYEFIETYRPAKNKGYRGYTVVVAYTVEYAKWLEMERQTTGYMNTWKYAKKIFTESFILKS